MQHRRHSALHYCGDKCFILMQKSFIYFVDSEIITIFAIVFLITCQRRTKCIMSVIVN